MEDELYKETTTAVSERNSYSEREAE